MIQKVLLLGLAASTALAKPIVHPQAIHRRDDVTIIPSAVNHTGDVDACQGYTLGSIQATNTGVDGVLTLKGDCNAYGPDYETLKLTVRYETADRLRVHIADSEGKAHVVPDDVTSNGWPKIGDTAVSSQKSNLEFKYTEDPFTFQVIRKSDKHVIFDTTDSPLIFEEQYLRIRSKLAEGSNLQGLGQHNDNFTLPITEANYTRTLWSRDAYGVPSHTNLYGNHPFYVNQHVGKNPSASGTYLLNSHGMDVIFPNNGTEVEFNALGGIADLFFFNGPSPAEVAKQASQVWGPSKEVPYWALGYHSCRYGYIDIAEVAEVIANYSAAGIPLQTQWMDIDYMYDRWIMTLDPDRFGLEKVRYVIDKLHDTNRDFIVMVDPATFSGTPNQTTDTYETFNSGVEEDIFLKLTNGDLYEGVVWPGPTVFPDWTHQNAQSWWNSEFAKFFDPATGVDVSGIWLDMNEPANFLPYLEANVYRISNERISPPVRRLPRLIPREIPGFPAFVAGQNISASFGNDTGSSDAARRSLPQHTLNARLSGAVDTLDDYLSPELDNQWLYPPYQIDDRRSAPSESDSTQGRKNISDYTARTDVVQANGARIYDEHNLYGSRHAIVTRNALVERYPAKRPFTVARSSFSGTPSALWLGDNLSTWDLYIATIRQMLQFTAVAGVGVIGADTCGFGGNTTETLCARWTWLGAFNTFYRNHNGDDSISQESYRWNLTTIAARASGRVRLELLDYTYTMIHQHSKDGSPTMYPLSWLHPTEANTVHIETQFYYGPSLLISPVVNENATSVDVHIPKDVYYDYFTYKTIQGKGAQVTLTDVGYDTMPVYIRGGSILPLRNGNSYTTGENQQLPFKLVVAPGADGTATGSLYLDDGESLDVGDAYSEITFKYDGKQIKIDGKFGYNSTPKIETIVIAGQHSKKTGKVDGKACSSKFDKNSGITTLSGLSISLNEASTVKLE